MSLNPRQLACIVEGSQEPAVRRVALDKIVTEVERLAGELEAVECDIRKDRTWAGQFRCASHCVWFRAEGEPEGCPVRDFAQRILEPTA